MKKIFISQPMKDKTKKEILEKRKEIIDKIKEDLNEEDIEFTDTYFVDFEDSTYKNKPLYYLGKVLEIMSTVDMVYFTQDWYKYRGCKLEHMAALEYGIPIID